MLVRLYSATTDRDALFLTMLSFAAILASAVLTIDTTFLGLFFLVSPLWRGHFRRYGDAARIEWSDSFAG